MLARMSCSLCLHFGYLLDAISRGLGFRQLQSFGFGPKLKEATVDVQQVKVPAGKVYLRFVPVLEVVASIYFTFSFAGLQKLLGIFLEESTWGLLHSLTRTR